MVYNEENYKNAKPGDLFEFVCPVCGNVFYKTKRQISKNSGIVPTYCSGRCSRIAHEKKLVKVICKECGKEYEIEKSEYDKKIRRGSEFFCSRSCAAKYNNKKYPKRKKEGEGSYVCPICGGHKNYGSKLCQNCENTRKTRIKREKTLGDFISNDDKYLTHKCQAIRRDARMYMEKESHQEKVCAYCHNHEFDDILEVHHLKGILMFDRSTKIKDINCDDNLVWLCPNHHAMIEKGIIDL